MEKPKQNTAVPVNSAAMKKLKIPRTFEIMVEEMHEEDDGTVRWRPVMVDPRLGGNGQVTITVNSPQELKDKQMWYERAGQRFKIIREINPPSREDIERLAAEQGVTLASPKAPLPAATPSPVPTPAMNRVSTPEPAPADAQRAKTAKIITLGDVQIKYDGDSVYQRQWVRVSPKEEDSIRVIRDADNKLVPMKGRHFEVKRWVKVEGSSVVEEL